MVQHCWIELQAVLGLKVQRCRFFLTGSDTCSHPDIRTHLIVEVYHRRLFYWLTGTDASGLFHWRLIPSTLLRLVKGVCVEFQLSIIYSTSLLAYQYRVTSIQVSQTLNSNCSFSFSFVVIVDKNRYLGHFRQITSALKRKCLKIEF